MKLITILIFTVSGHTIAQDLDTLLKEKITRFNLKPLERIQDTNPALTNLGHELFRDPVLSKNKDISCKECHHPRWGATGDGLPVSIGTGGQGMGSRRVQANGKITTRHANHLINKGHPKIRFMFWDGRVELKSNGELVTPEPALNGANPKAKEIAKMLTSPLAAQALFPIANDIEMFGANNEGLNNLEKWELISERVINDEFYATEFKKIYNVDKADFNIGYIGNALAHFQKIQFQVTNTKFDQYMAGDQTALNDSQKKGALLFMGKARCIACHNGPLLGGHAFQSSGAPQLNTSSGFEDQGRYEVTKKESHKYMFKIAPLRHIAHTAPYFHSGVFNTLEEVVDHYNHPWASLKNFAANTVSNYYARNYRHNFVEMTNEQIDKRIKSLPRFYQHHGALGLTTEEKANLVDFLKNGL
jgi:cytochrome c peroxidase